MNFMTTPLSPQKEYYSESEAARFLNISLAHLYMLLDEFVFNDGTVRPTNITFRESDLVLLGFWSKSHENPKVIRMPKRN
ncbi:MAG TPA: hypothetical protein VG649_15630 [Candidatus Angelobacter sp.]|jgi:hypothetical protein|nr:hypothetical protein [Candidatus Angelobacter sp.]